MSIALIVAAASGFNLPQVDRRSVVSAAFAASLAVRPALAGDKESAALLMGSSQSGSLAGTVKVGAKGGASTSLILTGPVGSASDYVDLMWFADSSGEVLAAAAYKPNGKSAKAAASADSTFIAPELKARFNKGATVVPYLNAKSGIWQGEPFTIN